MLDNIKAFANEHVMFSGASHCLVCVSGGADSMALLEVMMKLASSYGFRISVAHFNHLLRGDESSRDEKFVLEHCASIGVSVHCGQGDVRTYAESNKLCVEEAARVMRYNYFTDLAADINADRIVTAHNANDNAETILFNLTRGTSGVGLAGIPPVRGNIIRPMLQVSRKEIISFVKHQKIPYVEDSTNRHTYITRNKIRHEAISVFEEINPQFLKSVSSASDLLRMDASYISLQADIFFDAHCRDNTVDIRQLLSLHLALSGRIIRKLHGGNLSHKHVKAILKLCGSTRPSACLFLPGGKVVKANGLLYFCSNLSPGDENNVPPLCLETDGKARIYGNSFKISCKTVVFNDTMSRSLTTFLFKASDISGKLTVRPRAEGDRIKLRDRNITKSLKKLFIEERIPAHLRKMIPVIADDAGVLAVYGVGSSDRAVPSFGETAVMLEVNPLHD